MDFFVVPTVTFRVLYVLVIMAHDRRRILHFNVTTSHNDVGRRVRSLGIDVVLTAPGSLWQNAYCERLIGSIRRECLDHVVALSVGCTAAMSGVPPDVPFPEQEGPLLRPLPRT